MEISHRRVYKENDELLYTIWSLVMVRNQLLAQEVNLLRSIDVATHVETVWPKIAIVSQFQVSSSVTLL